MWDGHSCPSPLTESREQGKNMWTQVEQDLARLLSKKVFPGLRGSRLRQAPAKRSTGCRSLPGRGISLMAKAEDDPGREAKMASGRFALRGGRCLRRR
jgi:hypothetical protein